MISEHCMISSDSSLVSIYEPDILTAYCDIVQLTLKWPSEAFVGYRRWNYLAIHRPIYLCILLCNP